MDEVYRFHNYYIKQWLSDPSLANKKDLVDKISSATNQINKGSNLIGYG
jgi:hypothetical protein